MTQTQQHLKKQIDAIEEELENLQNPREFEILGSPKYEVTLNGQISEITLTVTAGGPTIRVKLVQQQITGIWGGDTHHRSINSYTNEEAEKSMDMLYNLYEEMWRHQHPSV